MEKIHGTSAHIGWKFKEKKLYFYHGGANRDNFLALFNQEYLLKRFTEEFPNSDVVIYGESYGGKLQGMSKTYGTSLKFVAFDVKIDEKWLNVPNAEDVCLKFELEFVDYNKVSTDLEELNAQRDLDSTQAIRNIQEEGKIREGVILRPLIEVTLNNGNRIIAKHKRDEFLETSTKREVNSDDLIVLEKAEEIANEWVTEMRLTHVLDKMAPNLTISNTGQVIKNMIEDIYREAKGEIVESKQANVAISKKTSELFKRRLQNA